MSEVVDRYLGPSGVATVVAGLGIGKIVEVGVGMLPPDPAVRATAWAAAASAGVLGMIAWRPVESFLEGGS